MLWKIVDIIQEYEGHLERLIKQRSQRLQNGQGGSVPMIDRRIAEYQEIIARLKAPYILLQVEEQMERELQWYENHGKTLRDLGFKEAYKEMLNFIRNLRRKQNNV